MGKTFKIPRRDNTGVLFKKELKETDNHPDYSGELKINGTEFWLNAWIKVGKSGKKYLSLSVKERSQRAVKADYNDKISF